MGGCGWLAEGRAMLGFNLQSLVARVFHVDETQWVVVKLFLGDSLMRQRSSKKLSLGGCSAMGDAARIRAKTAFSMYVGHRSRLL